MTIPTEAQYPYENLDRLVRVVMRPKGMSAKSLLNALLYAEARGDAPISYDIACALDPATPRTVGIFTGASEPEHYPNGENDGPLGTIMLAEGLRKVGHSVSLFIDPQLQPVMGALMDYVGHRYPVTVLDIDTPENNDPLADGLQGRHRRREGGHQPRRQGPLHHRLHPRGNPRQGRRPLPSRRGAGRHHRQRLRRHQRDRLWLHLRRRCRRRPLGHRVPLRLRAGRDVLHAGHLPLPHGHLQLGRLRPRGGHGAVHRQPCPDPHAGRPSATWSRSPSTTTSATAASARRACRWTASPSRSPSPCWR